MSAANTTITLHSSGEGTPKVQKPTNATTPWASGTSTIDCSTPRTVRVRWVTISCSWPRVSGEIPRTASRISSPSRSRKNSMRTKMPKSMSTLASPVTNDCARWLTSVATRESTLEAGDKEQAPAPRRLREVVAVGGEAGEHAGGGRQRGAARQATHPRHDQRVARRQRLPPELVERGRLRVRRQPVDEARRLLRDDRAEGEQRAHQREDDQHHHEARRQRAPPSQPARERALERRQQP